jgi:hypothetical protein
MEKALGSLGNNAPLEQETEKQEEILGRDFSVDRIA